jgi:tetratricopeptide (TPR) repeat protein
MSSQETAPNPSALNSPSGGEQEPKEQAPSLWSRLRWYLVFFIVALALSSAAGYFSGVNQREQLSQEQRREQAAEQFELGVQDLEEGHYELARQRFEYVLEIDPSYPGLPEQLAQVMLALNQPTSLPTSAATATPNLAPVEEMLDQARAAIQQEDWTLAINTLLELRDKDSSFQAVEVDGLMYQALRNRGVDRIANQALLEEGMYDLARAQTFGPLDRDAANWRSWAELYLKANSYMGVNWAQAVSYFAQVYLVAPYLRNDAYIKYAVSAQNYGNLLVDAGDPCAAEEMYDESLLAWDNATLYPTATDIRNACRTATTQPRQEPPPEDTPTPGGAETATPTNTPEDGGGENGNGNGQN